MSGRKSKEGVTTMIKRIGWMLGLLFLVWGIGFAQRIWEGTATVARYGEFPPSGLYGASNSFERNSIVDVENLSNGKKARIIITGRVSNPTQFLVVSEQVAAELGIGKSDLARVRVSPVVTPGIDPSLVKPELPLSPDPDINPSARISPSAKTEVSEAPVPGAVPAPTAPVDSVIQSPPIAPPSPPAPTSPVVPSSPVASSTPKSSTPEMETPWKEPDSMNPYAGLEASVAKRDKSAFSGLSLVLEPEVKKPTPTVAETAPVTPVTPTVKAESKEDLPKMEELPLEAPKQELKEGETQVELQLALEPAGPKPPAPLKEEQSPLMTAEVTGVESTPLFPVKEIGDLQRGSYYLQLGRFSRPQSAQGLWERFHQQYPLVVLKEEKGLRVMVGPVKSDERGILYHTFRALGLKDTFFVKID